MYHKTLNYSTRTIFGNIDGATYCEHIDPLFLKYYILKLKEIYCNVTCTKFLN